MPGFARLWPIRPPWRAPRCRLTLAGPAILGLGLGLGLVRSAILATAGLLVLVFTILKLVLMSVFF